MTFEYTLTQNDVLQYSLYFLKEGGTLKKQILKNWFIWLTIWTTIVFVFYFNKNNFGALAFAVASVVVLVVHPMRMKDVYFNRLQKDAISQVGKEGNQVKLTIDEDYVDVKGKEAESRIKTSAITSLIEIKDYFFLEMNDQAVIIPKSKVENMDLFKKEFVELTKGLKINFVTKLDWKW
jgi:YcxB-like protein